MITGTVKTKIDNIWNDMYSYGLANPLTVIEQLTYLFFIKSLDDVEMDNEKNDELLGIKDGKRIFPQTAEGQAMRWHIFRDKKAEEIHDILGTKVFPFIKTLKGVPNPKDKDSRKSAYARYMQDATFALPNALITEKVVTAIDELPLKDKDMKGDLYEYMIGKIQTAGRIGQFRTPRHIIKMMVRMMKPTLTDFIIDPACGTGGFLVGAGNFVKEHYGTELRTKKKLRDHFQDEMFTGYDTDQTMLRITAMNTILHGMDNADIRFNDSLSKNNTDADKYTLVLANPPFKGSLDNDAVAANLTSKVDTKKTELLFVALFLRMLDAGGRCACIVPDGVLFGASKAHKDLRKELVDNNKLTAVISMPSGVFKPYAGVSTAILIFTKTGTGGTDDVWFYDMKSDGYTLDDKRDKLPDNGDIDDIVARFENLDAEKSRGRTEQSFMVPVEEIRGNGYDLSINKYKKVQYVPKEYPPVTDIMQDIRGLYKKLDDVLTRLEGNIK